MSVCRFYLQGNCRNKDRCQFQHVNPGELQARAPNNPQFRHRGPRPIIDSKYTYRGSHSNNHNQHVGNQNATSKTASKFKEIFQWAAETFADKEKALDILEEMQREAKVWQKSEHLWHFTSKSLFPGGEPLPDWQNQSFEEIRWVHRWMSSENEEHKYKKAYSDYDVKIIRYLSEVATLKLDRLIALKDYISQYVASNHRPTKTLPSDIEMKDFDQPTASAAIRQSDQTNFTPDDELLEDERAAFQSASFEFGQIPVHAPSQQFC